MSGADSKIIPGHLDRAALLERTGAKSDGRSPWDALARLVSSRYSCRAFKSDPVPRDVIERAVSVAHISASWCNTQPWEVLVTDGEATERFRQALYAHGRANTQARNDFDFPGRYSDTYKARRLETAWQLYAALGIKWGDREASHLQAMENFRLFGAPHVMIVTSDRDLGVYGAVDTGIFIGTLLLALEALGVGAVAQAALAVHSAFIREHFEIRESRGVVIGISFGYPDSEHPGNRFRTLRCPPDAVIRWA